MALSRAAAARLGVAESTEQIYKRSWGALMHQLANRELILLRLGAVAVVLVLSTLGASGPTG